VSEPAAAAFAFLAALVIDGALAGAIYALMALAFVVVYKASRLVNFALGEWIMLAATLVAVGLHALGTGLAAAMAGALAGMVVLGLALNRVVLRPLIGRPLISLIMVTFGLGALLRGLMPIVFGGIPRRIALPVPAEPLGAWGVSVPAEKAVAAGAAVVAILLLWSAFRWSRTGIALRAIADDQQAAMAMGIDLPRHFALTWAVAGALAVLAGTLWTAAAGGGLGLLLVGLKVFPIVVIGGLDSVPGTVVAAVVVGVLESVSAGYLDPLLGAGFSTVAPWIALIAMLVVRPHGLFGRADVARV
jgi:branched-chain amino acid transport system permease protein